MLATLLCLLSMQPAGPRVDLPVGGPISLDGTIEAAEWDPDFSTSRPLGDQGRLHLHLKRTGPWLAIGLKADRPYAGEIMRFFVSDERGSWVCALFFGIGQPAMPPGLWLRGEPETVLDPRLPPECPRGVRARVSVRKPGEWSAEYLVRLSTFGIGRGDERRFRVFVVVRTPGPEGVEYLRLPDGAKDATETDKFAFLHPVGPAGGGWGPTEHWAPVPPEVSREFDDHELLLRLYLEHDKFSQRLAADELVISNAVRPRSDTKIGALRSALEAGRRRNPTLPAWDYFLGRLLHEANLYADARKIIESQPPALARLGPFVNLAAEHYIDTGEFQKALDLCKDRTDVVGVRETIKAALRFRREALQEKEFRAADARKAEKNPRVRFVTGKGEFVVELYEDDAPQAVHNFMDLVLKRKFYDGLTFHSVMGGSLVQTGDPRTRSGAVATQDNPGWRLRPDKPKRKLLRGCLAAIPLEGGVFHGSQFIISVAPLSRDTLVFGRVVQGMEVVERIDQDDRLLRIEVVRKRNHVYDPLDSRLH